MDPFTLGIISIAIIIALVFLGVRVAFAAGFVGVLGLILLRGWNAGGGMAGLTAHAETAHYTLSVLPMFILIGFLAYYAGLTQGAFRSARAWFGWMPGGLAVATVFATAGFAAVSGASTATAAVFSRVAIPEMLKYGYERRLAAGVVAAGGTLASLIPPSAILVIYAIIVEESVGALLLAGFIPGAVSALIYMGIVVLRCSINPALGRPVRGISWNERFNSIPGMLPIVAVIVIILGGIYTGVMTPTETGAVGAALIFFMAIGRRVIFGSGMTVTDFKDAMLETGKLTVMIFTIHLGRADLCALPWLYRPDHSICRLDRLAGHAPSGDHDPDSLCLHRPRHVHGRYRDAAVDLAGRSPGGNRPWVRSGLVRDYRCEDGGGVSRHPAHWA